MKVWTVISEDQLAENFAAIQEVLADAGQFDGEPTALLAVVKANAYGHGLVPCAKALAAAGAEWLGVTDAEEGRQARVALANLENSIQPRVLVMCGTASIDGEADRVVRHRLTPVVWTLGHLEHLAAAVHSCRSEEPEGLSNGEPAEPLAVHLEIETGMSRQGVRPGGELAMILDALGDEPALLLDGVLTHFASTEVAHSAQTVAQQAQFEVAIEQVAAAGFTPRWVHAGNSSYIDNGTAGLEPLFWLQKMARRIGARAMVRSGLALYGYCLPVDGGNETLVANHVQPVMTWKTRVIGVSQAAAGAAVGYDGTFVTKRPMRLALLPVGYADGLRRELSSCQAQPGGWVIIRGQKAAIIGRVSMNLTTVDVTTIDGVCEGDEAVLLGRGITADDHARLAETIAYEILCGVRTGG